MLILAKMSPAPLVNYNGTIQQDLVDILLQIQHGARKSFVALIFGYDEKKISEKKHKEIFFLQKSKIDTLS